MTYETEIFKALFREKLSRINQNKIKTLKQNKSLDYIPVETNSSENYSCHIEKVKDYLILTVLNNDKRKKETKKGGGKNLKLIKMAQRNAYCNK